MAKNSITPKDAETEKETTSFAQTRTTKKENTGEKSSPKAPITGKSLMTKIDPQRLKKFVGISLILIPSISP